MPSPSFPRTTTLPFILPARIALGLYQTWPTPRASKEGIFGDLSDRDGARSELGKALNTQITNALEADPPIPFTQATRKELVDRFQKAQRFAYTDIDNYSKSIKGSITIEKNQELIETEWPLLPVVWYVRESLKNPTLDPQLALFLYRNVRVDPEDVKSEEVRLIQAWDQMMNRYKSKNLGQHEALILHIPLPESKLVRSSIQKALQLNRSDKWPPQGDRMKFNSIFQHVVRKHIGRPSKSSIMRSVWSFLSGRSVGIDPLDSSYI